MSDETKPAKCPMCGAELTHCPKCGVALIDQPEELAEAERRITPPAPPAEQKEASGWPWGMERTALTCAAALSAVTWLVLAIVGIAHTLTHVHGQKINPLLNPFISILAGTLGVAQLFIFSRLNRYYATRKPPDDDDDAS